MEIAGQKEYFQLLSFVLICTCDFTLKYHQFCNKYLNTIVALMVTDVCVL
jgi:hypothetical protein